LLESNAVGSVAGVKGDSPGIFVIIDGSHRKWCLATLLLFLLSSAGYMIYARSAPDGPRGGSVPGMLFGIAGSGLMLYAGLISGRKKVPAWRIGSAQTWLRGHIWLGLLSIPLILFHAGFRWGGLLERVLLVVFAAIIVSGLVGLAVQQFLPRQMTARVPLETFYAQIPFECRLLQVEGDVAVAAACGPLPILPDIEIASHERLKALGVTEKKGSERKPKEKEQEKTAAEKEREKHQRLLASVYRLSDGEETVGGIDRDEAAATATVERKEADQPGPATVEAGVAETPKKLSAAEKIAQMRAAKQIASKPAKEPVATLNESPEVATADSPKPKMSAADKIALMRSAKKPTAAAPTSPDAKAAPAVATTERKTVVSEIKFDPVARQRACAELAKFYIETVRPFLEHGSAHSRPLINGVAAGGLFAAVRTGLPDDLRPALDRLTELWEARRQLLLQERMHHWLHGWLFVHVPLSFALLGLGVVHVVLSLYY
jgi:hypothetical protein